MHCLLLALSMLIRTELSGTFCAGQSDMAHTVSNALTRSSEGKCSKCDLVSGMRIYSWTSRGHDDVPGNP
jgi:hypothetical protein